MTLHAASSFNVHASLNDWLNTQINAHTFPAWLTFPGSRVLFTVPETTATMPCYTVHHIPVMDTPRFQGNRADDSNFGTWAIALMDVSCWAPKYTETDQLEAQQGHYTMVLAYMASLVQELVAKNTNTLIKQYSADVDNPTNTSYKVNFGGIEGQTVLPDINPNVERIRIVISYRWILRSS